MPSNFVPSKALTLDGLREPSLKLLMELLRVEHRATRRNEGFVSIRRVLLLELFRARCADALTAERAS
jgi:hypothetical protein